MQKRVDFSYLRDYIVLDTSYINMYPYDYMLSCLGNYNLAIKEKFPSLSQSPIFLEMYQKIFDAIEHERTHLFIYFSKDHKDYCCLPIFLDNEKVFSPNLSFRDALKFAISKSNPEFVEFRDYISLEFFSVKPNYIFIGKNVATQKLDVLFNRKLFPYVNKIYKCDLPYITLSRRITIYPDRTWMPFTFKHTEGKTLIVL